MIHTTTDGDKSPLYTGTKMMSLVIHLSLLGYIQCFMTSVEQGQRSIPYRLLTSVESQLYSHKETKANCKSGTRFYKMSSDFFYAYPDNNLNMNSYSRKWVRGWGGGG